MEFCDGRSPRETSSRIRLSEIDGKINATSNKASKCEETVVLIGRQGQPPPTGLLPVQSCRHPRQDAGVQDRQYAAEIGQNEDTQR